MSDDVKRYAIDVEFDVDLTTDPPAGDHRLVPEEDPHGNWVYHSDYEALRQRCERMERTMANVAQVFADDVEGEAEQQVLADVRDVLAEAKEPTNGR